MKRSSTRLIVVLFLLSTVAISCSSVPKKTILISMDKRGENWESLLDEFDVRAIHRGVGIHTKWIDVHIGKIGRGIRFYEDRGVNYAHPTRSIWGVRFIKWFNEPFV